jgi:hypothetical protein
MSVKMLDRIDQGQQPIAFGGGPRIYDVST